MAEQVSPPPPSPSSVTELMSAVAALKVQLDQQQAAQASILQQLSVIQQQQQSSPATLESSTSSLPPPPLGPSSDAPSDAQGMLCLSISGTVYITSLLVGSIECICLLGVVVVYIPYVNVFIIMVCSYMRGVRCIYSAPTLKVPLLYNN